MWFELLLAIFALIITSVYIDFKRSYKFWKLRNVPYPEPTFPTGNVMEAVKIKIHFGYVIQDIYTQMKHVGDYCGIFFFRNPVLMVLSPEFAKTILVRDFQYFADRGLYFNERDDVLSANLFFLEGQKWKKLRAKLTPTFTTGKLKHMFNTICDVGLNFVQFLQSLATTGDDIEIYDLLARFNTDVISSCAFGIDSNSLADPNVPFRTMGKRMLNFSKLKSLKLFLAMVFRDKARAIGIRFNDEDVSDFFMHLVRETIDYRKSTGLKRKDFMQLLIDLMKSNDDDADDEEKFSFNEIAAQAFVFYMAGFETSSTTLAFTLHSLAHHQDIQQKARDEVNDILEKHGGEWTYEAIVELNYVEQVISESLRLNPPVATFHRITTKEYTLPNGAIIPEKTGVLIPTLAIHRDPEYYEDPLRFNPDRFSEENKKLRHQFAYIPFGEGQRICIGMRFGLLQTKLTLALLLKNFTFSPCLRTENPIKVDPVTFIHSPKGKVWLKIEGV